ncbi:hypothetical protein HHK36_019555 [Tetracentron sinense]|uniref:Aminotransferase-like plant mobile domain-containing protein n=1 Tax=Tetracentron sinense TaxID=13715 RepID=A0A834YXK3_TETSI|nr:hypothetical protein HHK36_019555 [Tetracentron sinense]
MVRPKTVRSGGSSSARPEMDEDYVPPTDVEEQPIESSRAGASSSRAGISSSRGRRQSGSDPVPEVLEVPDTPLLKGLGEHISSICRTQEVTHFSGWRCSWKNVLTFYQEASPALRDALGRTPLGPFLTIPRIQSNRRLIAALCERWFGDTNTFHFPCCELAITPLDFVMLMGIPIVGEVIPPLSVISMDQVAALMGVSSATIASDSGWEAGKVKLSWLASILGKVAMAVIDLNSPAFTNILRVFLLFILGSCFFMTDRSCVETSFLSLIDPIDRFDTFDWGGAIYASILAGLCRVSRGGGRSARFFYPFLEMWAHEYLDPFCPTLRIPDITSFPRSSRWSAPCSKVDSHLLDKAREELDHLTLRRVTLQPFSDLEDMIQLFCRGARRFLGRRVAFSYLGTCEYFLGERVLHQSDGEFRIPLAPPEMTPALAHDTFMEEMRTAGAPIHHLVGEVVTHSFYLSWFQGVSIGPIMRPFSTRPGATEVGGKLVEKYFQMRPLLAILEEDNRALIEENARLRGRCATFEDPSVTFAEIPPYQCRPHPDMSFDFDAGPAQILEVAEQIMTGHSFIPMLLTETFRALDRCVQKRGGFFRGLTFLLFQDSPEMWYDQLIMLAPDMMVWKCSWLHVVEIISGTSGRHHLILIGLRGSSHYFPNRVVRQFGRTQSIPVIEAIKDVVEFGPSSEKLISRLLVGWKSRVKSTFGDDQESLVTGEYVRWLIDCCLPYVSPPHPCVGEKRKEPMNTVLIEDQPNYKELEERITSLLAKNAGLKAEVAKMGIEAAAYQDCIQDLRAQVDVLETVNEEFQ